MLEYLTGLAVLRYVLAELLRVSGLALLVWVGTTALFLNLTYPHRTRRDDLGRRWRELTDEVTR